MDYFEALLSKPENVTFMGLFLGLFIYTMKKNDDREARYQDTIDRLTTALSELDIVKKMVEKIEEKIG